MKNQNPVLLLNGDFAAVATLRIQRAVVLVLCGKAEVLETREGFFSSESIHMPVPSVIRLRYVAKVPIRTKLPVTRRNVLARDKGKCGYCGKQATTVDHIRPRSKGGRHQWENVVASCLPCNAKKDNHTLAEMAKSMNDPKRWSLDFKPWAPERELFVGVGFKPEPAWVPYLKAA